MTKVASFEIHHTQFMNEKGEITQTLPDFAQDPAKLIELYRIMVLSRAYDNKAIALQRTGKMGTYPATYGQEAIGTAIGNVMDKQDVFIPYYRDYAAQLQRGVKMSEIYRYWGGDERGSCFVNNQQDYPISITIASQCLHAAGVAKAIQYRKENRVVVVTCGDGGSSEGDFYEALNIAGVWNLPIVFVINNNQWAISVPLSQQTSCKTLAQKAIAGGFTGEQADGNDVIAVKHVVGTALKKARAGKGPTLIETLCYRLCDHTTADDSTRYQPREEFEAAEKLEPIRRLRYYLTNNKYWDDERQAALQTECASLVNQAVEEYQQIKKQPLSAIFDYHYANLPQSLAEQRQAALEEFANA